MGKYEIRPGEHGGVHFVLKAGNGEIVGVSQHYQALRSCKKGITSVEHNAPLAPIQDNSKEGAPTFPNPKFEIFVDQAGEYRFHLKARNGQIIFASEGYTEHSSCISGIESVKNNAASEVVTAEK